MDEQDEALRGIIIETFGLDAVQKIDEYFLAFHDGRVSATNNLTFLKTVLDNHGELTVAAMLYGMKLGELAMMWVEKQKRDAKLPDYGHAS